MAKVIDITEKLSFEDNPRLRIRDVELEVNADAKTVLRIMGIMSGGQPTNQDVLDCLDLLMSEADREKLATLGLSFADYMAVVEQAMDVATGRNGEDAPGEAGTRTTT